MEGEECLLVGPIQAMHNKPVVVTHYIHVHGGDMYTRRNVDSQSELKHIIAYHSPPQLYQLM